MQKRIEEINDDNDDPDKEPDPYLMLGYGIQAYFKMSRVLLVIFFFLGLLSGPIMLIYTKYEGMNETLPNHYMT